MGSRWLNWLKGAVRSINVLIRLIFLLIGILDHSSALWAQSAQGAVDCVASGGTGCSISIRGLSTWSGTYSYINAAGYLTPGDAGGGVFVADSASSSCADISPAPMGQTTAGSSIVTNISSFMGLHVGMAIQPATADIPPYDIIVARDIPHNTITLETPAIATSTGLISLTIGPDNGGTVIGDMEPRCFYRQTSTYNPREWGAYQNCCAGTPNDDTVPLQSWLNEAPLYEPVGGTISASGPHIAGPGNSLITNGLTCSNPLNYQNYNGTISGPSPNSVASGDTAQPTFLITAGDAVGLTFASTATAMLTMSIPQCSISSVGLIGSSTATTYDVVDAQNKSNSVLNHSLLLGGVDGFNCNSAGGDIVISDSGISHSTNDGIACGAPNSKFQRNVIASVGNHGIQSSGSTESLIEGNVIEESGTDGVSCVNSNQMGIVGNYFDSNGDSASGYNVHLNGCQVVSITGNQFHRAGGYNEATLSPTTQVYLEGANDSISMAGNVNFVGTSTKWPQNRPDYDVELASTASVTNFSYADSATPQNMVTASTSGIFGPNATTLLGTFVPPTAQQNYLAGLVTSDVTGQPSQLNIAPGVAMDSTNVQLINVNASTGCTVNLSNQGIGGIDDGSTVHAGTQYNFFVLSQGGYGSQALCVASRGLQPNFVAAAAYTTIPVPTKNLYGWLTNTKNTIVNVTGTACSGPPIACTPNQNPFAGLSVGDSIVDITNSSNIPSGTTIAALKSIDYTFTASSLSTSLLGIPVSATDAANLYVGEVVGNDSVASTMKYINSYVVITAVYPTSGTGTCATGIVAPCIVISNYPNLAGTAVPLVASGAFTITMSSPAGGSTISQDQLNVYNDRYRMVASLFTNSSSGVESFRQDGDTFTLGVPVNDINTSSVGTGTPTTLTLASVPNGISVEAFGRCNGGGGSSARHVIIYSYSSTSPGTPGAFPTAPGFDVDGTSTFVSFPYRANTNTTQNLYALADGASGVLQCMTDGWVWHRGK